MAPFHLKGAVHEQAHFFRRWRRQPASAPHRRHDHAPVFARDPAQLHPRRAALRHVCGGPPDTVTAEDLRRFQVAQRKAGVPAPTMDSIVSALRFFFTHTLDRPDLARRLVRVTHPRKLPAVLSPDEVARLLSATTCRKRQAALSVAYPQQPGRRRDPARFIRTPCRRHLASAIGALRADRRARVVRRADLCRDRRNGQSIAFDIGRDRLAILSRCAPAEAQCAPWPPAPAQPEHQISISRALHTAGSFLGDFPTPDGVRNSSRERTGRFGRRSRESRVASFSAADADKAARLFAWLRKARAAKRAS